MLVGVPRLTLLDFQAARSQRNRMELLVYRGCTVWPVVIVVVYSHAFYAFLSLTVSVHHFRNREGWVANTIHKSCEWKSAKKCRSLLENWAQQAKLKHWPLLTQGSALWSATPTSSELCSPNGSLTLFPNSRKRTFRDWPSLVEFGVCLLITLLWGSPHSAACGQQKTHHVWKNCWDISGSCWKPSLLAGPLVGDVIPSKAHVLMEKWGSQLLAYPQDIAVYLKLVHLSAAEEPLEEGERREWRRRLESHR